MLTSLLVLCKKVEVPSCFSWFFAEFYRGDFDVSKLFAVDILNKNAQVLFFESKLRGEISFFVGFLQLKKSSRFLLVL